jgi:hypothetical protein
VFRPSTGGRIQIVSLRPGQVVQAGHVDLDGPLISMLGGTSANVPDTPGQHTLQVEFVAVDHGPFDPRVRATGAFDVTPPAAGG